MGSAEHDVKAILSRIAHAHHAPNQVAGASPTLHNCGKADLQRGAQGLQLYLHHLPLQRWDLSISLLHLFQKKCHSLIFPIIAIIEQFSLLVAVKVHDMLASHFQLLQRNEIFPSKENVNFISRVAQGAWAVKSEAWLCFRKWGGRESVVALCLKIRCVSQQPSLLLIFKTDSFQTNSELTLPVFKITMAKLHSHAKDSPEDTGYSVFPTGGLNNMRWLMVPRTLKHK